MALLFMDGFDTADFTTSGRYSATNGTSSATTRFSQGKSIFFNATAGPTLEKTYPASAQVFAGFAFCGTNNTYGVSIITFYGDNGTTKHTSLRRISTTNWGIYRAETLLVSFAAPPMDTWVYIEMSTTIDSTSGTIEVRLNGQTAVTFTGNTRNGGTNLTTDKYRLGNDGSNYAACAPYIDDFYLCNSLGTKNKTFLGDVRVQTIVPSAAGSSTQWTPTGGANYANVNDIPDSTATYNSSSTSGQRDLYVLGDLLAGTGTVFGIQENLHAWKSDAGAGSLKSVYKVGSTVYDGTTYGLGTSNAWYGSIKETNPATSTTWTPSEINSLESGVEVV